MDKNPGIKVVQDVVIRFAGDSGDGMQLTGNLFSDLSAILGNQISTFPDFPAEIRAPQGTLSGVSGFQVHIGTNPVLTPGDQADVLVAMNPAALKMNVGKIKRNAIIIIDEDSFTAKDLKKAEYVTDKPLEELKLQNTQIITVPVTELTKESLKDFDMDLKDKMRSKNMFALGFICWLFEKELHEAEKLLNRRFARKEKILAANIKALTDGYNYGANTHASAMTYRIEGKEGDKGHYMDINGNKATAFGLVAAAEKAGLTLFLGSYPITPATDILHELAKLKHLGVKTVQAEDEIAGVCTAIGASFAGHLAATSTSGPGIALKSEAIGLAVITEIPLVIVDVQRGGPSTGMPTKSEQTDLLQVLYGRNGESPVPVIAPTSPSDCFDGAFEAARIALEHLTPVILLTDGYIANGASAWRIPDISKYPEIKPHYVQYYNDEAPWQPYRRDPETMARFWAIPGTEGFTHRIGGLEKDYHTGAISTNPDNHQRMVTTRQEKIDRIAHRLPLQKVMGDEDADVLVVGWGSTLGHIVTACETIRKEGHKIAMTQFKYINPLPENTGQLLRKFKKIVVCEQNLGQFAQYLGGKFPELNIHRFNRVKGQPFRTWRLVEEFKKYL